MKTMCPLSYHNKGSAATHALGYMMHGFFVAVHMSFCLCGKTCAQVHELPESHCGDNWEGNDFLDSCKLNSGPDSSVS